MDFKFTEEQEELRKQVRDFIEDELKKGSFQTHCAGPKIAVGKAKAISTVLS
jgi:alkylation response protein AidB-like acyl-CoA dehydrogenase